MLLGSSGRDKKKKQILVSPLSKFKSYTFLLLNTASVRKVVLRFKDYHEFLTPQLSENQNMVIQEYLDRTIEKKEPGILCWTILEFILGWKLF